MTGVVFVTFRLQAFHRHHTLYNIVWRDDSGLNPVDFGLNPVDSGMNPVDFGLNPVDSGSKPAGFVPV
jgi:hypothetical protein